MNHLLFFIKVLSFAFISTENEYHTYNNDCQIIEDIVNSDVIRNGLLESHDQNIKRMRIFNLTERTFTCNKDIYINSSKIKIYDKLLQNVNSGEFYDIIINKDLVEGNLRTVSIFFCSSICSNGVIKPSSFGFDFFYDISSSDNVKRLKVEGGAFSY